MKQQEPVIGLHPLNDCVLVELKQSSKNFNIKEGKYDSRTEGIVIALSEAGTIVKGDIVYRDDSTQTILGIPLKSLIGKRVHFEEFKEGARIKRNGKIYSFIKIEDIRGYENE